MAHALGLQALAHLLEAAAEEQKARTAEEEEGVMQLVQRWMFNLVKKGLTAPNLAVRQVPLLRLHLLLIKMAMWDPYSRCSHGVWFLWSLCKFVMGFCKVLSICRYKASAGTKRYNLGYTASHSSTRPCFCCCYDTLAS